MSLQQKCRQLKDELYRLKKNSVPQPKPAGHKEIDQIVFGNPTTENNSYSKGPIIYTIKTSILRPHSDDEEDEEAVITSRTKALNDNRDNVRQEMKEIENISNVPLNQLSPLLHKQVEKKEEPFKKTQNAYELSFRQSENNSGSTLKMNKLMLLKTQKKDYTNKGGYSSAPIKEDFAKTCNRIYQEKQEVSNYKLKELIRKTKINEDRD